MTLHLLRKRSRDGATIGKLSVNGVYFCATVEDEIREMKLPGKTAIPAGTYGIALTMSARFKRVLPLLLNVPGFVGIRIHSGNCAGDTEGCILPGYVAYESSVAKSIPAFRDLFAEMEKAAGKGEPITITIENPV